MNKVILFLGLLMLCFLVVSCDKEVGIEDNSKENIIEVVDSTKILEVRVLAAHNSNILKDIVAVIKGNLIVLESPYIVDASKLNVLLKTDGGGIFVGEKLIRDSIISLDLSHPLKLETEGISKHVEYQVECYYSGLPVLEINTPGGKSITSKEEWIPSASMKLINQDGSVEYEGSLSIKGRGNATWTMDKKSYALKLDEKAVILGMPADKRWVLLPNSKDHTLIKNALGFEIARLTNLEWTPRGEYVELVLNGSHVGNYYLTEKIKISKDRVNINKDKGFILEMDVHMDEQFCFRSPRKNIPYMLKDPDEVTESQFDHVKSFIDKVEDSIYDSDLFQANSYSNYIDIDSFVDWWIALELSQNQEPNHPASCYCYLTEEGEMVMGPVWDYDVYTFNSHYRLDTLAIRNALYYDKLFDSPLFVDKLKERWHELKPKYENHIPDFISSTVDRIYNSAMLDLRKWPYQWTIDYSNFDLGSSYNDLSWFDSYEGYDDAIATIRRTFMQKVNNLDKYITSK